MKIDIKKVSMKDVPALQEFMKLLMEGEHKMYDDMNRVAWATSKHASEYFSGRVKSPNGFAIVAVVKGNIVGYLNGAVYKGDVWQLTKKDAVLSDMFILEEYRSKKIGTKLTQAFFKWAKSKKAERVKVKAYAKNKRAVKFYKNHDFDEYQLILAKKL